MTTAEPLADTQAEAVMMALGPQWDWHEIACNEKTAWYGNLYKVEFLEGLARWSAAPMQMFTFKPKQHLYRTQQQAKSACEYHKATGKWE